MNYTLDVGRCIVRDETPIATVHGIEPYLIGRSGHGYTIGHSADLDDFARLIVDALNAHVRATEVGPPERPWMCALRQVLVDHQMKRIELPHETLAMVSNALSGGAMFQEERDEANYTPEGGTDDGF